MAFDGVTVAALVSEFNKKILQGRITKIAQPETDELILTIKTYDGQFRLQISANSSLPLIYLTETNKQSPMKAPNFCMLLRKHINNGFIEEISQPGLERIIDFKIRHLDELGDVKYKHLMIELMGKHSNIIFVDEEIIVDSIKHINSFMSSVRQVLPSKEYFIPNTTDKANPLETTKEEFYDKVFSKSDNLSRALFTTYTGISPLIAEDLCHLTKLDSCRAANTFEDGDKNLLWINFYEFINKIKEEKFTPVMYEENDVPKEFCAFKLSSCSNMNEIEFDNMSTLVDEFYHKRDVSNRIRQKSVDLRKIVNTALERENKKYNIQLKQLKDTEKKEKYKVYGDILTTYTNQVKLGDKSFTTSNFYNNDEEITIPLDPQINAIENAKKYFNKYAKLKRTNEALVDIIKETKSSIDYLESISVALNIAQDEDDLKAIKNELSETGYIKKSLKNKIKSKEKSKPLHFVSSDGFDIYVGKNNTQNEELTFKIATGNDWWFHAKGLPGSHVIVKANNQELPDKTFEEAAALAAYYSKGAKQDKVEIDYVQKKHVKKVPGAMPGFVIYHTNYSMTIKPNKMKSMK